MSRYRLVPLFQARVTGVAFDELERLATPISTALARQIASAEQALAVAASRTLAALRADPAALPGALSDATRNALGTQRAVPQAAGDQAELVEYRRAHTQLAEANQSLEASLHRELGAARSELWKSLRILRPYLVFASAPARAGLESVLAHPPAAVRSAALKDDERHFLLYLQRVCAKNDTLSEFGPSAWGRVESGSQGIRIEPTPGVSQRDVYLERWAATAVAKAMNEDPAVRPEVAPRLNPLVRLEGNLCILPTGAVLDLSAEDRQLLAGCDGSTAAHALGPAARLHELVEKGVLILAVEPPAMLLYPLTALCADVAGWRDGPVKSRWLATLEDLLALPRAFAVASDPQQRWLIMEEARGRLAALGTSRGSGQRMLYAATNPIGEDCAKADRIVVGAPMAERFVDQAAPWLDLWRDTYAFAASRIASTLRATLGAVPRWQGRVSLAALLHHCESLGVPLERLHQQAANAALGEVRTAFTAMIGERAARSELTLSGQDCHFVRRQFEFPRFDEFTWPSADLMIAATSQQASERGEYTWVLAELHPFVVPFTHCLYFACPDPGELQRALLQATGGHHTFMFAPNTTTHTFPHLCDVGAERWAWLGSLRAGVRTTPPAEVEVAVDESTGDVVARHWQTGAALGSLIRGHWRTVGFGLHPFLFSVAPHLPRLRVGDVIVQRESWIVRREELAARSFQGISAPLAVAVERLRAKKSWPRHCYIRPAEQVLGRSKKVRDKDVKPIYIDFESYLFMEIFVHWLDKHQTLEVTEMVPTPEQLIWREGGGRRCFELRTLIVPRAD